MQCIDRSDSSRSWILPSHPTRGKNPIVGLFLAFALGSFGVGIFLRSVGDFVMCFIVAFASGMMIPGNPALIGAIVAILWMIARIVIDRTTPPDDPPTAAAYSTADTVSPRVDAASFRQKPTPAPHGLFSQPVA